MAPRRPITLGIPEILEAAKSVHYLLLKQAIKGLKL